MMRGGRTSLVVAVALGFAGWAGAQMAGESMVPLNLSMTYVTEEEGDNIQPIASEVWEFAIDTGYCVMEEDDVALDLGIAANIFVFDLNDAPSFLGDVTTYSFRLPVTAFYRGIEDWTFALTASSGLFWDLKGIEGEELQLNWDPRGLDGDDLRMEYRGTVAYQVNEGLSIMAGADYEHYFDANRLTPVLGVDWQILEELHLKALLVDAKTSYRVDAKLTLEASECVNVFAMLQTAGDQWNLEVEDNDYDFFYQATRCGFGVEIGVAPNTWLQLMGGIETDRDAQVKRDGNWVIDDDVNDGAFARIGLTVR